MATAWWTLGARPPGKGAPRHEQLRFVRDFQLRALLAIYVPTLIVLLAVSVSKWFIAAWVLAFVVLALDTAYLTFRMRQLERR